MSAPALDSTPSRAIQWPAPPFFPNDAVPQSAHGMPCLLELTSGRNVSGELIRFEPTGDSVTLILPQGQRQQTVSVNYIRAVKLTVPVPFVPDAASIDDSGVRRLLVQEKDFDIRLRDGTHLKGRTRGFLKEKAGLFLFIVEDGVSGAIRCFIPARHLDDIQIGPLLGETLVEAQVLSNATVESALEVQAHLREERIGNYLTSRAIITSEELTRALAEQQHRPNARLGDLLVEAGLITQDNLNDALAIQSEHRGRRLGDILMEMGAVSVQMMQRALSEKLGIPYVNVRDFKLDPLAIELVDGGFATRQQVLPLLRRGESLIVAVENPLSVDALHDLRFSINLTVLPVIADPAELKARIAKEYARLDARIADPAVSAQGRVLGAQKQPDLIRAEDLAYQLSRETPQPAVSGKTRQGDARVSDNTLVRLVNKMIVEAHAQGASDIHLESNPGQGHTRIRFRRDGELEDYLDLPPAYRGSLVSRIKVMANLDISEHRHPQDGKIDFGKFGPLPIELRVSIIPTTDNLEDVVLRILGGIAPRPLADLALASQDLAALDAMIRHNHGLILVCGPTGSGKTTTLHSMLREINSPDVKIWTAEDPIEITQPGLRQVQVQPKIDWTFAAAMRAFLRADPDVIMVGEMRDAETAKIGIEASLTGHLVFSTLHTNSAAESVTRLLDLGMEPYNFADALVGILSQRLARSLCRECRRGHQVEEMELAGIAEQYCRGTRLDPGAMMERWQAQAGANGITIYEAVGCTACRGGYRGRIGIYELLSAAPEVKQEVRSRAAVPQLVATAQRHGMRLLRQDAIEKMLAGFLDLTSVRAVSD